MGDRRQGHPGSGRHADRVRRRVPASRAEDGLGTGRRPASGAGRVRAGQDRHHLLRLSGSGAHAQSLEPAVHARRLVDGIGRGGRDRHGAGRDRHADGGIGVPARLVLRGGRLQAVLRSDLHGRLLRAGPHVRHHRLLHPHRAGHDDAVARRRSACSASRGADRAARGRHRRGPPLQAVRRGDDRRAPLGSGPPACVRNRDQGSDVACRAGCGLRQQPRDLRGGGGTGARRALGTPPRRLPAEAEGGAGVGRRRRLRGALRRSLHGPRRCAGALRGAVR